MTPSHPPFVRSPYPPPFFSPLSEAGHAARADAPAQAPDPTHGTRIDRRNRRGRWRRTSRRGTLNDHVGSPVTESPTFARIVALDHGLSVVTTVRADGSIQASVVNAGVLTHPLTGANVVGFVAQGGSHKLAYLRADARSTVVVRAGWQWAAVEGLAEIFRAGRTATGHHRGRAAGTVAGRVRRCRRNPRRLGDLRPRHERGTSSRSPRPATAVLPPTPDPRRNCRCHPGRPRRRYRHRPLTTRSPKT